MFICPRVCYEPGEAEGMPLKFQMRKVSHDWWRPCLKDSYGQDKFSRSWSHSSPSCVHMLSVAGVLPIAWLFTKSNVLLMSEILLFLQSFLPPLKCPQIIKHSVTIHCSHPPAPFLSRQVGKACCFWEDSASFTRCPQASGSLSWLNSVNWCGFTVPL